MVRSSVVEPILRGTCYRGTHSPLATRIQGGWEMTIDVKYKLTPVAFPHLDQRWWHDKLQTPQSQGKKCKNSHTLVGKTTEVWRVGGSAFVPIFS